jgi:antirestriction protein ArdC
MTTRKTDLYERVTEQVMAAMEAGTTSWRMPWHFQPAEAALPSNPVTKRSYRGINVLALWMQAQALDYPTALWATYQQWQQLGAQVKQGEHGTVIVLWKPTGTRHAEATAEQEQEPEPKQRRGLLVRGYTVFNAAQVEGYTRETLPTLSPEARIEQGEAFFAALGADIRHGGNEAYYQLETDHIQLPPFSRFVDPVSYYGVLAHEVTHWSGAPARLGRNLTARFGFSSALETGAVPRADRPVSPSAAECVDECRRAPSPGLEHRRPGPRPCVLAAGATASNHQGLGSSSRIGSTRNGWTPRPSPSSRTGPAASSPRLAAKSLRTRMAGPVRATGHRRR